MKALNLAPLETSAALHLEHYADADARDLRWARALQCAGLSPQETAEIIQRDRRFIDDVAFAATFGPQERRSAA